MDDACWRRWGGAGAGAAAGGVVAGAGPAASAAAAGNRHASARLADGAAVGPLPRPPPPRPAPGSGVVRLTIRVNDPEIPRDTRRSPPRARPRNDGSRTGFPCRCRSRRPGWRGGDRGERREDVHTRCNHTGPSARRRAARTLERRLPLQLESRLAHRLGEMLTSFRIHDVRCASRRRSAIRRVAATLAPDDADRGDCGGQWRTLMTEHHRPAHFPAAAGTPKLYIMPSNVPRYAPVGDRQAAPMVPGRDLIAARPQLFAGLAVERVDGRVPRVGNAPLGIGIQPAADPWTIRLVPGEVGACVCPPRPVREHHAVGDDDLFGHVHVAREPRRIQPPLAGLASSSL